MRKKNSVISSWNTNPNPTRFHCLVNQKGCRLNTLKAQSSKHNTPRHQLPQNLPSSFSQSAHAYPANSSSCTIYYKKSCITLAIKLNHFKSLAFHIAQKHEYGKAKSKSKGSCRKHGHLFIEQIAIDQQHRITDNFQIRNTHHMLPRYLSV